MILSKTYTERQELQKKAAEVIDSPWHFSWHWPHDGFGNLTAEGWEKAYKDGHELRMSLIDKIRGLDEILPDVLIASKSFP